MMSIIHTDKKNIKEMLFGGCVTLLAHFLSESRIISEDAVRVTITLHPPTYKTGPDKAYLLHCDNMAVHFTFRYLKNLCLQTTLR